MTIRALLLLLVVSAVPLRAEHAVRLEATADGAAAYALALSPALGTSWQDVNVGRLTLRTPGLQRRLDTASLAKTHRLPLTLEAGCSVLLAELGPGYEKGRPDAWARVSHVTKIVACAGDEAATASLAQRREAGSMVMAKTGSRAEIQPMVNTALLRPGVDLPVRAYCEGSAAHGREVAATAPDGTSSFRAADRVGAATFRIDQAGPWAITVRCPAGDQRLTASLQIEVLDIEAWTRLAEEATP